MDGLQNIDMNGRLQVSDSGIFNEFNVIKRDGTTMPFDEAKIRATIAKAAEGCSYVSIDSICKELAKNIFNNINAVDLEKALVLSTIVFIERDPEYDIVAMRLLKQKIDKEVFIANNAKTYKESFISGIKIGVQNNIFSEQFSSYDLEDLAQELVFERDQLLGYMGLNTLYERYFSKNNGSRMETIQSFWMRIAMGLALAEKPEDRQWRAKEFYNLLSTLKYVPSTPTLFNSGFPVAQLSSCYLSTVSDDLNHIFKVFQDNAQLSKWAGGIGNDWTNIRGTGSYIKSIKAYSQGVVPYLKIANDIIVCITKSGIRRGGACVYLESWHLDIEDFLDLRRNTGDERRRTHDMNTANWIPDLLLKRVLEDKDWTLFSPDEVPDLHDLYGKAFEERYNFYEQEALAGRLRQYKVLSAKQLWRKMLTRLFETGHPWITFKDPSNIRSPQDHVGVVHSSNLCTEITLNTSETETAVCNLGSINLSKHINLETKELDRDLLSKTIRTAVRMLDNVIDLCFYPTVEAKNSNLKHRPVGLGLMGFQDALYMLDIPFEDARAKIFADNLMEEISYNAITVSNELAQERGSYASFAGSKWSRGLFPLDTIDLLEKERGIPVEVSRTSTLDWDSLKQKVKSTGLRNSNLMAIAPTATISTIAGCFSCIEPVYENIYVESNISGEFTIINKYLVDDLKKLNLWNKNTLDKLKYFDGKLSYLDEVPDYLKAKYKTVFEIDQEWLIELSAARSKWIDQAQSHNVFVDGVSGAVLNNIYLKAFKTGMKTTYYLRTLGASQIEKSTLDAKVFGFTQKRNDYNLKKSCNINNPSDCESCQ